MKDYSFLLNRPEHHFDAAAINVALGNKRVLVTGAGGSIGSALVRRLYASGTEFVGCMGHSEAAIFALKNSLPEHPSRLGFQIADVSDWSAMRRLIDVWAPDLIFHAAAHKHVNLMQNNPREALRNNTLATLDLAELAVQSSCVRKFVFISTDKAVRPTCVMGASKRLAEVALLKRYAPSFVTVCRFGNVLGSAGSLVEIIENKIAKNERLRITDPKMERFFITAKEAVGLVLTAALLEPDGELFTLAMGPPVPIMDILQKFSNRHPLHYDVIGAGAGEKLREELTNPGETLIPANSSVLLKIDYAPNPQVDMVLNIVRGNPNELVAQVGKL
jgi:FlaA1/EpsC-like NDP-sugar epimerase